jgi:hypothetical protein
MHRRPVLDPHECAGHHCGTIQVPVTKLRPTLGIAIHIHSDALGQLDPAGRVEKAGTITTTLLAELLGEGNGYNLKVQPVIDLPNLAPADNYVPSAQLRRGMVLAFSTNRSRSPHATLSAWIWITPSRSSLAGLGRRGSGTSPL